jgi:hypothetical protein
MSTTSHTSVIGRLLSLMARRDQAAADVANGLCPSRHPSLGWACELPLGHPVHEGHVAGRLALSSKVTPGTHRVHAHDVASW